PDRVGLSLVRFGQATPWRGAAHVLDPKVAERFIYHAPAIGADMREPRHLHIEAILADALVDVERVLDEAGAGDMERDVRDRLGRDVDAVDVPASPVDDRSAIRSPANARIDVMDRPSLLHVALKPVGQRVD